MNTLDSPSTPRRRPGFAFIAQIALGIWLLLSPFLVAYEVSANLWNTVLAGAAVIILAMLRAGVPGWPALWFINLLPGVWLIVAPFLFDYARTGAFWNSVIVGVLTFVLAVVSRGAVPGQMRR